MDDNSNKAIERKSFIRIKIKLLVAVCLFLGFFAGLFLGINYCRISTGNERPEITRSKGYKFISPLLDYETKSELRNKELIILKSVLEKFINAKIEENEAIYVSVYFRDLLNGPWFGINESDSFAPASLLKVPVMIAYLKQAEQNPEILQRNIVYDKIIDDISQNIHPDKALKFGESYSIEELICRMIAYSDNLAKDLLMENIDEDAINKVYADLGMVIPGIIKKTDFITTKEYASLFRILFNASYLNREMSEKALDILSKSDLEIGIAFGVPKDVVLAHKFGERRNLENGTAQFHDCGIVYYIERPYLLCIMTYGRDLKELNAIVEQISEITYETIDRYYKSHEADFIKATAIKSE